MRKILLASIAIGWGGAAWAVPYIVPAPAISQLSSNPAGGRNSIGLDGSGVSFVSLGAACDGVTDDTAAINAALSATPGGLFTIPANRYCLINSANLSVTPNSRVVGASSPFPTGGATIPLGSGFLVNPAYSVLMGSGTQLENLGVWRAGITPNPTAAQATSAVTQWGTETSVGVIIPANIGGVTLKNLFVVGFNTGIKASSGQFSMQRIAGDNYNGLEVTTAGDNYYIDDTRFEPFYALSTSSTSGSWTRPGIAFNLHDGNTGGVLTRVFSYMWANGLVMNNIGVTQIGQSGFEWEAAHGNGMTGTKGIRWINHNSATSTNNTYSIGFDTAFSDEGGGEVIMNAPSSTANNLHFYLGGQITNPVAVTFSGSPAVGNIVTVTITSAQITSSPLAISYTVKTGDSLSTIVAALSAQLYRNQPANAAGFFANPAANVLTVYWPATANATVSVVSSGSITTANSLGTTQVGSLGSIIGADVNDSGNPPVIQTVNGVTNWTIVTPFISNGTPTPSAYIIDAASLSSVNFSLSTQSTSPYSASLLFGTGSDGSLTLSNGTLSLTRDMHYTNAVITGTGNIQTNGYQLYINNSLQLANAGVGAISYNGNTGNSASGSTAGSAKGNNGPSQGSASSLAGGYIGWGGGTGGTGTGANGTNGTMWNSNSFLIGGATGVAGVGGAGSSAGGTGGTIPSIYLSTAQFPSPPQLFQGYQTGSGTLWPLTTTLAPPGGGAGGGDGTNAGGGGGGGGTQGGMIVIHSRFINRGGNSSVGMIQAKGGAGGAGGTPSAGAGGGGGGGSGAGGGFIYIVTEALLGSTIASGIDLSGGAGGAGGSGLSTGKGGAGGSGGNGGNCQIVVLSVPSFTVGTFNAAGVAGSTTTTTTGGAGGAGATTRCNF